MKYFETAIYATLGFIASLIVILIGGVCNPVFWILVFIAWELFHK